MHVCNEFQDLSGKLHSLDHSVYLLVAFVNILLVSTNASLLFQMWNSFYMWGICPNWNNRTNARAENHYIIIMILQAAASTALLVSATATYLCELSQNIGISEIDFQIKVVCVPEWDFIRWESDFFFNWPQSERSCHKSWIFWTVCFHTSH